MFPALVLIIFLNHPVYCERVFVALGIQHAMRMCHTVICGLPRASNIFHTIS